MASKRPVVDWELVERDYRAGIKSIAQIAREAGVSRTAVQKRATSGVWSRDLGARVRVAANAKLAREVAATVSHATEVEIIDAAAGAQVAILREHRLDIGRARSLSQRLLGDLEAAVGNRETLAEMIAEAAEPKRRTTMQRAVGLPSLVGTFEALVRAQRTVFALERQAFGIDDRAASIEPTYEERLRALYNTDPYAQGA